MSDNMNEPRKGLNGLFANVKAGDLWKGVLVVLLAATLTGVEDLVGFGGTASAASLGSGRLLTFAATLGEVFLVWILSTALIHGLSRLMHGKGSMRRLYALNGFAYIPIALQVLFSVIDVVIFTPGASPATGQLSILLSELNLFNLATIALSTLAVASNYGFSRRRSLVIVLVPVLILLVLGLLGLPVARTGGTSIRGVFGFGGRGVGGGGGFAPGG